MSSIHSASRSSLGQITIPSDANVHAVSLKDHVDCMINTPITSENWRAVAAGYERVLEDTEDESWLPLPNSFEESEALRKASEKRHQIIRAHTEQLHAALQTQQELSDSLELESKKRSSQESKEIHQRALKAEKKSFALSLKLNALETDLRQAERRLKAANNQITSLQSALEAANAKIHTLQQSQTPDMIFLQNREPPSRVMERSEDHTPQNKETWSSFLQKHASGFAIGFFRMKEPSRAPHHPSNSVSVQSLSSSDEEDQQSTEDASLTSCGPAPPGMSWGARVVSWMQAACQAVARGFRICFCKH